MSRNWDEQEPELRKISNLSQILYRGGGSVCSEQRSELVYPCNWPPVTGLSNLLQRSGSRQIDELEAKSLCFNIDSTRDNLSCSTPQQFRQAEPAPSLEIELANRDWAHSVLESNLHL
jgi:hypothetical protein